LSTPRVPLRCACSRRSRLPFARAARSDGTEKITVDDGATVGALRRVLEATLKVPYSDQTLSLDQRLVRLPRHASAQTHTACGCARMSRPLCHACAC
jgi:hypothetical protein